MPPDETKLTDRELDVMSILWQRGSGTVAEVRKALADRLAYTTVLWALQTLEEKGHVRHEKEGRAYRYYAVVEQETAGGSALNRLVDKVFHGSVSMLLAQLVGERDLPADELRRIRDLLDRRLAGEEDE
jgi:BlaI family penicillinase repressor